MTVRVDGKAAPATVRSARGNDVVGVVAEGECLTPRDQTANATRNHGGVGLAVLVEGNHFVELNNDAIEVPVVGNTDGANDEVEGLGCRGSWRDDVECVRQRDIANRQIGEQIAHEMGDCSNLLLFALQGDDFTIASYLNEKYPLPGTTESRGRECIGCIEVAVRRHGTIVMRVVDRPVSRPLN